MLVDDNLMELLSSDESEEQMKGEDHPEGRVWRRKRQKLRRRGGAALTSCEAGCRVRCDSTLFAHLR